MTMIRAVVVLATLKGASAGACDGACTFLSDGLYCPVNDVREHADINKDVAAIATHLKSPPDYAAAKTVYEEGLESSKGGGTMRTLQDLAQKDMVAAGHTNNFFTGARDLYGGVDNIWHNWIVACLDESGDCAGKTDDFRTYIINKGLIGTVTAYVTYEMGVAITRAAGGSLEDGEAAYYWDEAAAFHIGRKELDTEAIPIGGTKAPGSLYSPWEFNWKRDADFPDGVMTHEHAMPIFNHGLLNLRGTYDETAVAKAQMEIYKIYAITAIRSAIKYGWKAYNSGTMEPKYLAEGAMYWRSASGYLSTFNRSTVEAVDAIFALDKTTFTKDDACQVKVHVESLYEAAGISCAEVGVWKDAEDCLAEACSPTGTKTLSTGDDNYVEGCGADLDDDDADSATVLAVGGLAAVPMATALTLLL